MSLTVETLRGPEAFEALREPWRELFARGGDRAPFRSLSWAESWWRHLAPERVPHLLTARDGDRLVGLLALCEQTLRPARLPVTVRRLAFLGEGQVGSDYLDVLALPGREDEATEAIVRHLAEERPFDILELDGIDALSRLTTLCIARMGARMAPAYSCPQVDLSGQFKDVLARGKRGDNFKRRLKQLKALDGFDFRRVVNADAAVAAFDRFLELHEKRWSGQGGSDAMGGSEMLAFHRDMVVRLAREGRLSFDELWVEGGCRATIYGIRAGSSYCFYQSGYDPEWARRSVGLVTLGLSIEAAQGEGARVYDLLRGTESYKFDWATTTRELGTVRLVGRSLGTALVLAGEGAEAAARQAAHAVLPTSAVERLRRWRRSREHQT